VGGELRAALALAISLQEISDLLGTLDRNIPYPGEAAEGPRGRLGSAKSCTLPENWLNSRELNFEQKTVLLDAELSVSGG